MGRPLAWDANTLRRMAWGTTHMLKDDWERERDAKEALQQIRWGMLLTMAAPEWAQQIIREDIQTHKADGRTPGSSVEETFATWLEHMRREWVERYPVAAFGGETETPPDC